MHTRGDRFRGNGPSVVPRCGLDTSVVDRAGVITMPNATRTAMGRCFLMGLLVGHVGR